MHKNTLSTDRKNLYMVLSILILSIFTLTMAYAALSTTLSIKGQAEVSASAWDIHLDNVVLNSSSATTVVPTITDSKTATFSTTLTKPGDFYEFTIDVVNNGSIDAMIDSVIKTPELTDAQEKYLNYIVEYQNGEEITTKQLIEANSFVRLKVKVEFRKDLVASDLPTSLETLNLSFTVNYVQSDDSGSSVKDNGIYDPYKVGNEICIGEEYFYIISSDEDSVTMLAKMNITTDTPPKQSNSAPTLAFSSSEYWGYASTGTYVYNSNSSIYNYVENYRAYLESQGAEIEEARLIKYEELTALGCNGSSCTSAPEWVYETSYWSGAADGRYSIWNVNNVGAFARDNSSSSFYYGIRPVIVLSKES